MEKLFILYPGNPRLGILATICSIPLLGMGRIKTWRIFQKKPATKKASPCKILQLFPRKK